MAGMLVAQHAYAEGPTPGYFSLSAVYTVEDDQGVIRLSLTAPLKDDAYADLPEGTVMDIRVTRSCTSLGEEQIEVASLENVSPGQVCEFTDEATPAWQYGYEYTYAATAYIGENCNAWPPSAYLRPGLNFAFSYSDLKLESVEEDGQFHVVISGLVPSTLNTYPPQPLPVDIKAIEIERVIDPSAYPYEYEHIGSITEGLVNGEAFAYTDMTPNANTENVYRLKAVTDFGTCESIVSTFVGHDVPSYPYGLTATPENGGYRISWTAPTSGMNNGSFDPEDTFYKVYRSWGRNEDERLLIADNLKEPSWFDDGADMEKARMVNYTVECCNSYGTGGYSDVNYMKFILPLGPADTLPYVETFSEGTDHLWTFATSYYSVNFSSASEISIGENVVTSASEDGSGLLYADFDTWGSEDVTCTATTYKIDVADARKLAVSFKYYAIPDNDVEITFSTSSDGEEFTDMRTLKIAEGLQPGDEMGWKEVTIDLNTQAEPLYIRFSAKYTETPSQAVIDDIQVVDPTPVIPDEFTSGDYIYRVSGDNLSIKQYIGTDALIDIPTGLNFMDKNFSVTGIDAEAFKDNTSIVSVNITENVTVVGESAFENCTALAAVSFAQNVAEIQAAAFKGCSSLALVIFKSNVPPVVAPDAFDGIAENCKGTCPLGYEDVFDDAAGLENIDFGSATGSVSEIMSDYVEEWYFDMNGCRIINPLPGQVVIEYRRLSDGSVTAIKKIIR